jgi:hypothetical protein
MSDLDAEVRKLRGEISWSAARKRSNRRTVPAKPAVYAFISSHVFGRLSGKPHVLYVGRAV